MHPAKDPGPPKIRLQPKQAQLFDLLNESPASWIGVGGGRGCAKSYALDAIMLLQRMIHPGTVGCIVMRNHDQVRKYHIETMIRNFPQFTDQLHKTDANIKFPAGDNGQLSQIDFSYAENLYEVERRFRSANYYHIFVDQAEQFTEAELREMKNACRWPGTAEGQCKMLLSFNMGGAGIQTLRKWFHTHEYNARETRENFAFVHIYPWDNVEWARAALAKDRLSEKDYYRWSDEKRMAYCADRTEYGRSLNSLDDALRNRDWLGSWDSLEGAYFGRVFDRAAMLITPEQAKRLIKPWDVRWLSQDWGKAHFNVTYWFAKTTVSVEDAYETLGWETSGPIKLVVTYRELVINEMSSTDLGQLIAEKTPLEERPKIKKFFLSPDAFGERDSPQTTADNLGKELREHGLPAPEKADNDRIGGWMLMYALMADTKRQGAQDGQAWVISGNCPHLLESIPLAMRDVKKLDDVQKTDQGQAKIEQDCLDAARYGTKSMLSTAAKPFRVLLDETLTKAPNPQQRLRTILEFEDKWKKRQHGLKPKKRYQ